VISSYTWAGNDMSTQIDRLRQAGNDMST